MKTLALLLALSLASCCAPVIVRNPVTGDEAREWDCIFPLDFLIAHP